MLAQSVKYADDFYREADTAGLYTYLLSQGGLVAQCIQDADKYKIQILYSEIDSLASGEIIFRHYTFRNRPDLYINPASTIKLPASILALEKVGKYGSSGLSPKIPFQIKGKGHCQKSVSELYPGAPEKLTLENTVKMALCISDDDAYNNLFDFAGHRYLNQRLSEVGFSQVRIHQKFTSDCNLQDCKFSPEVVFLDEKDKPCYVWPATADTIEYVWPGLKEYQVGKYWQNAQGTKIAQPRNFKGSNVLQPQDLHECMARVMFPSYFPVNKRFRLSQEARQILLFALRTSPGKSGISKLKGGIYHDAWKRYFFCGNKVGNRIPEELEVYNVVGQSYGFLMDCAYVRNIRTGRRFILTACVYVNENEVLNDGIYEYKQKGFPFLLELSNQILKWNTK